MTLAVAERFGPADGGFGELAYLALFVVPACTLAVVAISLYLYLRRH